MKFEYIWDPLRRGLSVRRKSWYPFVDRWEIRDEMLFYSTATDDYPVSEILEEEINAADWEVV